MVQVTLRLSPVRYPASQTGWFETTISGIIFQNQSKYDHSCRTRDDSWVMTTGKEDILSTGILSTLIVSIGILKFSIFLMTFCNKIFVYCILTTDILLTFCLLAFDEGILYIDIVTDSYDIMPTNFFVYRHFCCLLWHFVY